MLISSHYLWIILMSFQGSSNFLLENRAINLWKTRNIKLTHCSGTGIQFLNINFSNSKIIFQVKIKKSLPWSWFGYLVLIGIYFDNNYFYYFFAYSIVFVSIEKHYQTLETMLHQLPKYFKFCQKYSIACHIFNSLLGIWISKWHTASSAW